MLRLSVAKSELSSRNSAPILSRRPKGIIADDADLATGHKFLMHVKCLLIALPAALMSASCSTTLPTRTLSCSAVEHEPIETATTGATSTASISVLTYNIEGLGWPARKGRSAALAQIGDHLSNLRSAGRGPDIVLFQEMFSGAAKLAVSNAGYPAIATGPRRTTTPVASTRDRLPGHARIKRGEIGFRFVGSGLAIASRFPIVLTELRAYGRRSCAGIDCLSNKGIMLARIVVPGVPTPIDVYNTHLNSSRASRAPSRRRDAAHERQAQEATQFIDWTRDVGNPLIFGGDFNMRNSDTRWSRFSPSQSLSLVHKICEQPASGCDVRISWDGDAPWMDTQDLQFYRSGSKVMIRPIRVEAMFDGRQDSPALSDHDGFLVTYQLSWPSALRWNGCRSG